MKQFLWNLPAWIDRWRIWPRAMITVYLWLLIETCFWFMGLPAPNPAQAAFVSAMIGAGAAWWGLYIRQPGKDQDQTPMPNNTPNSNEDSKG